MTQRDLLAILRCPDDHSHLSPASDDLVRRVNNAIRDGSLVNRGGKLLEQTLDGGLLRNDGTLMYPIIDEIPILLHDDAIPLEQLDG